MMSNIWNRSALAFLTLLCPAAALADISGTATVNAGQSYSLDTGAVASGGGGDITFTGSALTYVGSAKGGSLALLGSGAAAYASLTSVELTSLAALATTTPIPLGSLPVNTIVGVATNGGNPAKLLITASSASSISFQYTTFISTTPTIKGVQNNYSYLTTGLPNYGIAPSTIFIITGTNLASTTTVSALQSSAAPGLPTSLNGASISVTVGGVTTHPAMYYAISKQIAAVLPASTPTGTGTITVTYNGTTSAAANILVVPSALGLISYYGTGSGLINATDVHGVNFTYTNSASPGQSIILWGSGLGADTADSDTTFTSTPHAVNQPLTVYIGGVAVTPTYAGSSGYPGLDQINVTIPSNVATGCGVAVVGLSGNVVSNSVTLPIGAGGGVCTDPLLGYNGTQLTNGNGQAGTYTVASLGIQQSTSPQQGEMTYVDGNFQSFSNVTSGSPSSVVSLGSCFVSGPPAIGGSIPTTTGLDAGTITVQGPTGSQTMTQTSSPLTSGPTGDYNAQVANSFLPATGGTFTFTGSGGANVGAFTVSVSLSNLLTWTNESSISTVTRASGQQLTWSGGTPNSYVYVSGSSASASGASATFICYAPVSAGQLTVPNYVLLALPAGTGNLGISNSAAPASFTATGLSGPGIATGGVSFAITPTYN
jgi:uncharacterized protein (TIGR03437 family)